MVPETSPKSPIRNSITKRLSFQSKDLHKPRLKYTTPQNNVRSAVLLLQQRTKIDLMGPSKDKLYMLF
jgi:hypothetical protein